MMAKHKHKPVFYKASGINVAKGLFVCECGYKVTALTDVETGKTIRIEGNYCENINSPIFIIHNSDESLKETLEQLKAQSPDLETVSETFIPVKTMADFEKMRAFVRPRYILTDDFYESDLIQHPMMRLLLSTGHF